MANTLEIVIKATNKASGTLKGITKGLDNFHGANKKTLDLLSKIGKAAAVALTAAATAVVALGVDAIKTAVSVESAFAGVIKTTEGLTSAYGVLNAEGLALKAGFKELAETIPLSVEELMRIGELGGQIGIAKEDLLEFTETIAAMAASTDLTADAAATSMARFMNIMGTPTVDISRLGSVIVDLGNKLAATEPEILEFGTRLAGAGKIAGLTDAAVMAIAGAFSSVGVQAEAGGTAVQKVLIDIEKLSQQGGEALADYAKVAGVSAQEFGAMWEKDAGRAFAAFVEGLGKQGNQAIGLLEQLGIDDARQVRGFLAMAGAGDLMTRAMEMANEAWEENTALTTEAGQRYATTASQIATARNKMRNFKDTLGQALQPVLAKVLGMFGAFAEKHGPTLVRFIEQKVIPAVDNIVAALGYLERGDIGGALAMVFGGKLANDILNTAQAIKDFVAPIIAFVQEHSEAFKAALLTIGAVLAGAAIAGAIASIGSAIAGLLSPVGLVIAAVALLAQAWANDWGGIQEKTAAVVEWLRGAIGTVTEWMRGIWAQHGEEVSAHWSAMWAKISETASAVAEVVKAVVGAALEAIRAWWSQHGEQVMVIVRLLWDSIKTLFETAFNAVREFCLMVMDMIAGDWTSAGEHWQNIITTIWEGIKTIFTNQIAALWEIIKLMVATIVDIVKGIDWKGLGRSIINGIKDGVVSRAKALAQAVAEAAKNALNAAKRALGISSPSKVAALQIGIPFVEGIGQGIDKAIAGLAQRQMPQMATQMVSASQRGMATAGNRTINQTYNLIVNTNAATEPIVADFNMMRAFAG